ncbi:aldehyde dehydrogenase family protein [Mumia sp. DW29H23]|uniref:aldehyde dehydrogenase family protein n=1 Tax=Mumia sp. DW29H23 TaxID=3421241 RepID=UPI003D691396
MTTTVSFRPRTGDLVGTVRDTLPEEVAGTVAAAAAAAPVVAAASPAQRRDWLEALAQSLLDHRDELARLADSETALGLPRLLGEVERAAAQLRFYADVAVEGSYLGLTVDHPTATAPGLVRVNQPLGPVAVFGASNFPFGFGVLGNDTASALAAGCPVVAKAHPAHVLLCARLGDLAAEALAAAGAPVGTFGLVVGFDAGVRLVEDPDVRAVGFTGSQAGGLALWRLANARDVVIPVYAEMGTVNPAVMTPASVSRTADVAAGFVGSFTLGSGQFCTKPGLLLAPAGHGVPAAVARALTAATPSPTMLTRGIADAAADGVEQLVQAGAQIVARVEGGAEGWSADAVVLTAPPRALHTGSRLLEECFGPVAVVVEYASVAEAVDVLGRLQGSLAATVVTDGTDDDPDAGVLLASLARGAGRVTVDDWPTGVAWTWAQQHGGPWPATSAPASTSVGAAALDRFVRPVSYQSTPDAWLPPAARAANPWQLPRRVDGKLELP